MTFCLGIRCASGLVAIADTRLTSGNETSVAKKIDVERVGTGTSFLLTSGLRSVRDKALIYFRERLERAGATVGRAHEVANLFAEELRRVRTEDRAWLAEDGLAFDLHCIIGGQASEDNEVSLYLIYPEGNWVEVPRSTPYVLIGESAYGKPILDRVWRHDRSLDAALRAGLLAFDATRTSASDVDYPVDCVLYERDSFVAHELRLDRADLSPLAEFWNRALERAEGEAAAVTAPLFDRLRAAPATIGDGAGG